MSNPVSEIDERKRKRKESNRKSARRSRMKKQRHVEELVQEMGFLQKEICSKSGSCEAVLRATQVVEAENRALRAEEARLEQRLRSLEWMLVNLGDAGYLADNIFHVQEAKSSHMMEGASWQLHRLHHHHHHQQPIMASGTFNY